MEIKLAPAPLTLRALLLLPRDTIETAQTISIPIAEIVAEPWDERRMADARRLLAEGHTPPPVKAVRLSLSDKGVYHLCDGNHRCVAAREAGHREIMAEVVEEQVCRPERCWIRGAVLYRLDGRGHPASWEDLYGCDDLLTELRRFAVAEAATMNGDLRSLGCWPQLAHTLFKTDGGQRSVK